MKLISSWKLPGFHCKRIQSQMLVCLQWLRGCTNSEAGGFLSTFQVQKQRKLLINSSLSAPTKIEELTAGSDEKTHRRGCAVFFRLIRLSVLLSLSELKEKSWLGMIPTRASLRLNGSKSSELSLVAACFVDSGNPGHLVVGKELTAWWKSKIHTQFPLWLRSSVVRACYRIRKILGSIPGGAALCFFVWSGCQFFHFVGAEREELIRNDPDKSEFTKENCYNCFKFPLSFCCLFWSWPHQRVQQCFWLCSQSEKPCTLNSAFTDCKHNKKNWHLVTGILSYTVKEKNFRRPKFCTLPSKTFRMEFNSYSQIDQKT